MKAVYYGMILLAGAAQATVHLWLYQKRIENHSPSFHSDAVIFIMPMLVMAGAYYALVRGSGMRPASSAAAAISFSGFCLVIGVTAGLNIYGS